MRLLRMAAAFVAAFALSGCLGPAPKEPKHWLVEAKAASAKAEGEARFAVARLSHFEVRAPYDRLSVAVLKKDGSIVFDPENSFASSPAAMLKNAALDALSSSGLFADIVEQSSGAGSETAVEIYVTRIAVDCRVEGVRSASVALKTRLLDGRKTVAVAEGEGAAPVADGRLSSAFSDAFAAALAEALGKI